ncbi:unnamed protein product [Dibothriocephalus latus]|uniref:RPAP1 N-terminal domain-containing protein n=1 Tax=Dibothriocephalus latus TaxID=60516 RepID=A0A3P6RA77_DIBLA|nr:unnamed protein product [Dibothriocephalus latus]
MYNPLSADPSLRRLAEAGPRAISGTGLGSLAQDVFRIHETNMDLLAHLSPEEILKEREEILASAGKSARLLSGSRETRQFFII